MAFRESYFPAAIMDTPFAIELAVNLDTLWRDRRGFILFLRFVVPLVGGGARGLQTAVLSFYFVRGLSQRQCIQRQLGVDLRWPAMIEPQGGWEKQGTRVSKHTP